MLNPAAVPAESGRPDAAIGLVGAGSLGVAIGRRLLGRGLPLVAWNRSPARLQQLATAGAVLAEAVGGLLRDSDVVIVCLSDADAIRAVLLDDALHWSGLGRRLVLNTSTVGAEASQSLEAAFAAIGVEYADLPVSGGPEGAASGTLAAYVAPAKLHADTVERIVAALAGTVIRCRDNRTAQQLKVLNNLCEAINLWGAAEAIALGRRLGLSVDELSAGLTGGRGDSRYLRVLLDHMRTQPVDVAVSLAIRIKDLELAEQLAGKLPPLSALTKALFNDTSEVLGSSVDQCACLARLAMPHVEQHFATPPAVVPA